MTYDLYLVSFVILLLFDIKGKILVVKVLEIRLSLIEKHTHTFKKVPGHS